MFKPVTSCCPLHAIVPLTEGKLPKKAKLNIEDFEPVSLVPAYMLRYLTHCKIDMCNTTILGLKKIASSMANTVDYTNPKQMGNMQTAELRKARAPSSPSCSLRLCFLRPVARIARSTCPSPHCVDRWRRLGTNTPCCADGASQGHPQGQSSTASCARQRAASTPACQSVVQLGPACRSAAALCRALTPALRTLMSLANLSGRSAKGFSFAPCLLHNILHDP